MKPNSEFRILEFLSPTHIRTSGLFTSYEDVAPIFAIRAEDARKGDGVQRIALFRYTNSRTELMDEWFRPGAKFTCKLRHEVVPTILTLTSKAA